MSKTMCNRKLKTAEYTVYGMRKLSTKIKIRSKLSLKITSMIFKVLMVVNINNTVF